MSTLKQSVEITTIEHTYTSQHVRHDDEHIPPNNKARGKKPLCFYMTFLGLNISVLLVSIDATALSVAVPVSLASPIVSPLPTD
jgi:hypothetical protein